MGNLSKTCLYDLHLAQGAKMVPFAGFEMPVQYPAGVMREHLHTRTQAGLFDVSHMGQVILHGDVATRLERLIPQDVQTLGAGRQRYGFFTNDQGGILDDLMFANLGDQIFIVVNAACKVQDIALLQSEFGSDVEILTDRALLALQGPQAVTVLGVLAPSVADMRFMDVGTHTLMGVECLLSRSGYTGEDGFEISMPAAHAKMLAEALLADERVAPIGLGARDSLRLEAGLCLYGHDIDETTSPVEAGLVWAMQKRRREEGGFRGDARILAELENGPARKRVGLRPMGRAPMREGTRLFSNEDAQTPIGIVTSGGFGPTLGGPLAMGYVQSNYTHNGTKILGELRGRFDPLEVVPLPFVPANFKR